MQLSAHGLWAPESLTAGPRGQRGSHADPTAHRPVQLEKLARERAVPRDVDGDSPALGAPLDAELEANGAQLKCEAIYTSAAILGSPTATWSTMAQRWFIGTERRRNYRRPWRRHGERGRGKKRWNGSHAHPGDDGGDGEARGGSTVPESKKMTARCRCSNSTMTAKRRRPEKHRSGRM